MNHMRMMWKEYIASCWFWYGFTKRLFNILQYAAGMYLVTVKILYYSPCTTVMSYVFAEKMWSSLDQEMKISCIELYSESVAQNSLLFHSTHF